MIFNGQQMSAFGYFESLTCGQGRSAKYEIKTAGWKRILNVIRASNGSLQLGLAKAVGGGGISTQALGIQFTGNVNFVDAVDPTDPVPVIYQLYNHEMGHNNDSSKPDFHARITKVRVGYPQENTEFPNVPEGDTINYRVNNINCYVDIYVDFTDVKGGDTVQLNMNYAGFSNSHNCTPIYEETDAAATGIYGEALDFYEFTPTKDAVLYMPNGSIMAKAVHAENVMDRSEYIATTCPAFSERAALVQCYPMKGTQLDICFNQFGADTVTDVIHCGKNLYNFSASKTVSNGGTWNTNMQFTAFNGNTMTRRGFIIQLPAGTYALHAEKNDLYTAAITLRGTINNESGEYVSAFKFVTSGTCTPVVLTINKGDVIYIYDYHYEEYGGVTIRRFVNGYNIQIEAGSVATPFEEYVGANYKTPANVTALEGVNTIYSRENYANLYCVTGKAEPAKYMENLTAAILSLGGNV